METVNQLTILHQLYETHLRGLNESKLILRVLSRLPRDRVFETAHPMIKPKTVAERIQEVTEDLELNQIRVEELLKMIEEERTEMQLPM